MNVADALSGGRVVLGDPLEAEVLLAHVLGKSREFFLAHPESSIAQDLSAKYRSYCKKRAAGIPLAHLTHNKEFYGLSFYVDERVLIPRPETEILVEETIALAKNGATNIEREILICDVGTGSGCIAIALAKQLSHAEIIGVDISDGALEVAKINAEAHAVSGSISFEKSDLLEAVSGSPIIGIVANLPYIGRTENHMIDPEVANFEPHEALFGGETGLELLEKLFEQTAAARACGKLLTLRWLAAEIGFRQRKSVSVLLKKYFPAAKAEWKKDLAGLDRVFVISF